MSNNRSWDSQHSWQDTENSSSDESSSSSGFGGFEFPLLPSIPSGSIDIGTVAPVFGVAGFDDDGADYLEYDKAGRPFMELVQTSCGSAYFTGIFGGGLYGAAQGLRKAPSPKFKIRLNSVMNQAALRGSKAGNALGCLALIYKGFEQLADTIELERVVKYDQVTPILASAATGLFYKSTAGPKAMVLASAIGAGAMTLLQFGVKPFQAKR
ncbi:hypothetical protein ABG067_006206 [Albugo candida]|uniref:Mitochondrial import inner membrane translocase subunit TIM23 n=1 Tax=Albugo candida TaxID=65357 RepID=A0A024GQN3_9STRA|nr:unnamed protein product [Albugo candida]|eukprot:CCI48673.1 unnamed protein product [Albugo candida]